MGLKKFTSLTVFPNFYFRVGHPVYITAILYEKILCENIQFIHNRIQFYLKVFRNNLFNIVACLGYDKIGILLTYMYHNDLKNPNQSKVWRIIRKKYYFGKTIKQLSLIKYCCILNAS